MARNEPAHGAGGFTGLILCGSWIISLLMLAAVMSGLTMPALAAADPIGNASFSSMTCPSGGITNATCYEVVISDCAGTPDNFVAVIKVNDPPSGETDQGTIFFTTSGGGNGFYDVAFPQDSQCPQDQCGYMVVQDLNSAGYRTVQIDFTDPDDSKAEPAGWITGPGTYGHRSLACRYATLVHEVWVELLGSSAQHPVCATGNSAGGSLIGYAITQYGMGNPGGPGPMFTMVEPTSGPPMGRIDHGCMGSAAPRPVVSCPANTRISENYGLGLAKDYLDPAFSSDVCTVDIESDGADADPDFHYDSVLSTDYPSPSYLTFVKILYGSKDLTQAVPLGLEWYDAILSSKAEACIAGAAHELPGNYDGANQIVSDLTSSCQLAVGRR